MCLLVTSMLLAYACAADTRSVTEKSSQLDKLRNRISTLQQSLTDTRHKKSQAVEAVRAIERQISETLRELKRLDQQIELQQVALKKLRADRARRTSLLSGHRQRLLREIRSGYAMGKQQTIKLLFNQQDTAQLGRMLSYYGYFSKARASTISEINHQLAALRQTETDITGRLATLEGLQLQQLAEREHHEQQVRERKLVVGKLSKALTEQGGRLSRMEADEKQLAELIASLRQALADIPEQRQQGLFKNLKGKMSWPASGTLKKPFGARLSGTDIRSAGVLIRAPEGGPVRSVAQGRVAFADWIRGYGLLMIIDHGDGYMSLYGYNQVLYKEVGEWVDTGEVIAALGRSGGQPEAGLYFELRFNGQPVDPGNWCSGKPAVVTG